MPGVTGPLEGIQAFVSKLQALTVRVANVESQQRQIVTTPVGTITQWGGATPPAGALLCDGSTYSAAQYPQLFAVLGSTTLPTIAGTPIRVIWT